jgi:dipeptidase E
VQYNAGAEGGMELHLFSTPGPGLDIKWVLDACREVLGARREATVAYLPQASLEAEKWLRETERSFRHLAQISMINTETMELDEMESILRRAALVFLPGGNGFLLNHRLHTSRLLPALRKKIHNGLPVVAFSAGTVVCGPNVLTSNDLNMVPTNHFAALGVTPFNFNVHYDDSAERDNWLIEYHSFHDNAVIMLKDGAYIKVAGKNSTLVRGDAWLWRAGREKEKLVPGTMIPVD